VPSSFTKSRVQNSAMLFSPLGFAAGFGQGGAVEADDPGVGLEELGDHPHGGGLAGPVGAEETHHLATVDGEADAVHGGDAVEALGDAIERE